MIRTGLTVILCLLLSGPNDPPAPKGKSKPSTKHSFSLPGKTWTLKVPLTGFKITENQLAPDKKHRRIAGENRAAGINLTIFLEPAEQQGDSKACRKFYQARLHGKSSKGVKVTKWESGDVAAAEYEIGEGGLTFWNINGYLAHDSVWIDIHLSKMSPTEKDKEKMRRILKLAEIGKAVSEPAMKLFFQAGDAFRKDDYKQAAKLFQKALDLEKKDRTFEQAMWRVMVDQLGMAYGMSGDLDKCREVLEYGIQEDPKYPLFYYNLACMYAEQDDLAKALENLEKAFERRKNLNPLEEMPDPKTDSSFKKYRDRKEFRETLKKIGL